MHTQGGQGASPMSSFLLTLSLPNSPRKKSQRMMCRCYPSYKPTLASFSSLLFSSSCCSSCCCSSCSSVFLLFCSCSFSAFRFSRRAPLSLFLLLLLHKRIPLFFWLLLLLPLFFFPLLGPISHWYGRMYVRVLCPSIRPLPPHRLLRMLFITSTLASVAFLMTL